MAEAKKNNPRHRSETANVFFLAIDLVLGVGGVFFI